jgi:hypothetical protein
MELVILHDGPDRFTTDSKLSELKFGGVHERTNIKGFDGEMDRVSGAVKNGGN